MRYGIIDIGSNTVKCGVYTNIIDKKPHESEFYSRQLGLIGKIENGALPEYAVRQLTETISEFKSLVLTDKQAKLYCFATESMRRISNFEEVREIIFKECAVDAELICGEREALLSYEGFRAFSPEITEGIMADMGGGSTEILKFSGAAVRYLNSFKFGCLSLRRDFVKGRFPCAEEEKNIREKVTCELAQYPWIAPGGILCFIGGTGKALGRLLKELGIASEEKCTTKDFLDLFNYLSAHDKAATSLMEECIPSRVETILPGMCAYRAIIEKINADKIVISKGGIRDGFLIEKLHKEKKC